jgi:hypothetical protein
MPLVIPTLDDRKYQELLDEAIARIPVHTPEWTNFNRSDPGITLIEIFAFMTENLLYRSNQIPERNRKKFLQLLGIPLQAASSARGLVTFTNERGPLETITLNAGLEVRAGQVPFRTEQGLDILPIETRLYYKREITGAAQPLKDYYNQLYASFLKPQLAETAQLYEVVSFPAPQGTIVDLGKEAIDNSLWIALLVRASDKPVDNTPEAIGDLKERVRRKIGGKVLSLGVVPSPSEAGLKLAAGNQESRESPTLLTYEAPVGETLSQVESERLPRYRALDAISPTNILFSPGVVQITLPPASELKLWDNLDPLESGVGDFPPALEDTTLDNRLLTWVRVRTTAAAEARLLWAGINVAPVAQRAHVTNERLPNGTGTPDQTARLSKTPVIPGSVRLTVSLPNLSEEWTEIADLTEAGPEVPVRDQRTPPGSPVEVNDRIKVFTLNSESGEIRFGDGLRGARPPLDALIRADYDYGVGRDGNVNENAINSSPALPAGIKVTNAIPTWGGAEAEAVSEGEKQIAHYLQHRERLVTGEDFKTITRRTPGVDIGRVEVLTAFNPQLGSNDAGDAPGAVTLMVIPKYDAVQPDAPSPDRIFLDAICRYIDQRRLVTSEIYLRGPVYKPLYISIGINVESGFSVAEIRETVKQELLNFLSPLPKATTNDCQKIHPDGYPLGKSVVALELLSVANRVRGVLFVNPNVLLAEGTGAATSQIEMRGLQLPRVVGISVALGDPLSLDDLRGRASTDQATQGGPPRRVPVPVIPEECK